MSSIDLTPSALSKLTLTFTLSRVVGAKSSIIGIYTSPAFMDVVNEESEVNITKGKSKRGKMKVTWDFNRNTSEKETSANDRESSTNDDATEGATSEANSPEDATAAAEIMWKGVVGILMKDKEVKMMFANPKFKDVTTKIMSDPALLGDPLKNFRDELKDKAIAKAMMGLMPKLEKAKAEVRIGGNKVEERNEDIKAISGSNLHAVRPISLAAYILTRSRRWDSLRSSTAQEEVSRLRH